MKVSIIVPAFNEEKLLGESLAQIKDSARAFDERGWTWELVVCDNNSTDRTAEIARAAGAQVIFEPFNQIGRARNTGASAATGDWFIFVDADSHPNPDLFADVMDQIVSGKCLAGGSTLSLDVKQFKARLIASLWNLISRAGRWLAGSFIFVEAAAFREIGGFNNAMFAAEELDLCKRLKKLARERKKKIVVLHRHPLITSARKLRLYSVWEHFRLMARITFNQKVLADREACILWYDGRR